MTLSLLNIYKTHYSTINTITFNFNFAYVLPDIIEWEGLLTSIASQDLEMFALSFGELNEFKWST